MSIARVETPSASSSNSSPASRAPASESVAPQVRIGERRKRKYTAAATNTAARKRVSFIVQSLSQEIDHIQRRQDAEWTLPDDVDHD